MQKKENKIDKDYPLMTVTLVAFIGMATVHLLGSLADYYIPAMHTPFQVDCAITERLSNGVYITHVGKGDLY